MPSTRTHFAPTQSRPLLKAVLGLFFTNGVLMGAWVGALPGLRHRIGTDAAGIGWVLIVAGLGAITSMQVAGRVADRTSARAPALLGVSTIVAGLVAASFAPTFSALCGAALIIGCGNGAMGVAMNALGVNTEAISARKVMSIFHAMASLGGFAGAAVIVVVAHLASPPDDDPRRALWCACAASAISALALARFTPRPHVRHGGARDALTAGDTRLAHGARLPTQAWLLGVMALLFGFTEGAAVDWSSIHVSAVEHVSPALGAVGLVCVTLSMVSVRLVGDHLVHRWGSMRVLRCASPLAAVGFIITATCRPMWLVLLGWVTVGFGVALIAPQIYGLAGRLGAARALALVSGFGYTAFLTGPGLVGWLAGHVGIQHAMAIPLTTSILLVVMTHLRALSPAEASAPEPAASRRASGGSH